MIESTGLRGYGFKIPLQSSMTIDDFQIYEKKKKEIQEKSWK